MGRVIDNFMLCAISFCFSTFNFDDFHPKPLGVWWYRLCKNTREFLVQSHWNQKVIIFKNTLMVSVRIAYPKFSLHAFVIYSLSIVIDENEIMKIYCVLLDVLALPTYGVWVVLLLRWLPVNLHGANNFKRLSCYTFPPWSKGKSLYSYFKSSMDVIEVHFLLGCCLVSYRNNKVTSTYSRASFVRGKGFSFKVLAEVINIFFISFLLHIVVVVVNFTALIW